MKIEIHAWPYNDINFPQYCLFLSHFQPVTEVYFPFRKKINMLNQKQAENNKIINALVYNLASSPCIPLSIFRSLSYSRLLRFISSIKNLRS